MIQLSRAEEHTKHTGDAGIIEVSGKENLTKLIS